MNSDTKAPDGFNAAFACKIEHMCYNSYIEHMF